jgi:DNA segregation ATPase FtsK/SpoIIIE, S-DNA-T family
MSLTGRAARGTGQVLSRHRDDVVGLLLIGVALVLGLGIYGGAAGPLGLAAADGATGLLGRQRFVLPGLVLLAGLALIWRRGPAHPDDDEVEEEEDDEQASTAAHVGVGCTLLMIATAGLLQVHAGMPTWKATLEELSDAGGWLGVVIGRPLYNSLSTAGATLLLTAVAAAGLVVLTRTPIRVAAGRTNTRIVRPAADLVRAGLARLFVMPGGDRSDDGFTIDGYGIDDGTELGDADDEDDTLEEELDPDELAAALAAGGAEEDDEGKGGRRRSRKRRTEVSDDEAGSGEQLAIALGSAGKGSPWKLPPLNLLVRSGAQQIDRRMVEETGRTLERALAEHGVETRLVGTVVGPTVSRYELELAPGVKVNRVTSLHKDIAYAMATPDVRILAPIPGKQAIGVEVPNVRRQVVALGDILGSEEARKATHPLDVAVGRDINGRSVMMNLAAMPHILIAGATGAGKSSCLNSLLTSVLMRSTPEQVRMILVDPKRVEMGQYDRLPHLLTQVVTNPKKAANALAWAVKEMERRYDVLAEVGFRDVNGYNAAVARGDLVPETDAAGDVVREFPRMPYVLVVIDELADLMMVAARDVEESICRLAQMARAVGIHLVIATQRPSVNVITGLIKANVPARLAFAVSSVTDSRVILDQQGAERLIGKGDMLLLEGGSSVPRRLQGAWVTEEEVRKVAGAWKRQAPDLSFDDDVQDSTEGTGGGGSGGGGGDEDDDLLTQAMELVVQSQLGSTSMLQRKLRVGFARAGRLMDLLEQRGVVGPSEGSKARAVLMTVDELEEMYE